MTTISAQNVKALREQTGLGMMDCKRALQECDGDIARARDLLRIRSGAKANKIAGREAAEGAIACGISGQFSALVEINCETDFVARDSNFGEFAQQVAEAAAKNQPENLAALADTEIDGEKIEAARQHLIMKVGENIAIRRFEIMKAGGAPVFYIHHGAKIGAMADVDGDSALGREICMHIAAARPRYLQAEDAPESAVQKEREIALAQAKESGKPPNVAEKIADGRMRKFFQETALLHQPFIKEPSTAVGKLLDSRGAKIHAFALFALGESESPPAGA